MSKYVFTLAKAKEIHANNNIAKEEAVVLRDAFKDQGNEEHAIEGSASYSMAVMIDTSFFLVAKEYGLLVK